MRGILSKRCHANYGKRVTFHPFARTQMAVPALVVALPIDSFCAAMYTQFFRLTQPPFSISPDPRYLFMSERHREALAHLLYGVDSGGGVVLLTGDIGAGKTTICRCFLERVPANCNVAYIFNPKLTVDELLQSICEEFHIELPQLERYMTGAKDYIDALNRYLIASHAEGRNNVLVIDEAQNLSADVLEQLRLLTNLETHERKLLQIILIGQPELRAVLARPALEQLAQRVIAHYHLTALTEQETASYIQHRLATAGLASASPFQPPLMKLIHRLTQGVPRRINLLCDRALLGAYARGTMEIDSAIIDQSAAELFINQQGQALDRRRRWKISLLGLLAVAMAAGAAAWTMGASSLLEAINARRSMPVATGSEKSLSFGTSVDPVSNAEQSMPPALDTVAGAQHIFSEKDGSVRTALRSEKDALRELSPLWNISPEGGEPCEAAKKSGVHCHRSNGGFAELRRLDRPAILKLHDATNKPYYAVLTALGDTDATLRAHNAVQNVSLVILTRHFRGEFITLWRAPAGFDLTVGIGDRGPEVDWIATQLAKLDGVEPPLANQPFGQDMQKQIRRFQRAHGLFVDGVTGPVTVMHLNRVAGVVEPRLRDFATSGE